MNIHNGRLSFCVSAAALRGSLLIIISVEYAHVTMYVIINNKKNNNTNINNDNNDDNDNMFA